MRRLLSGCGHTFEGVSSRNELCPCGSGRKYKRCCLDRLGVVARELRERDELLGDVTAWLREEHEQTIQEAGRETTVVRMLGGRTGRGMSTICALNDYVPADGGPALMARYAERPELDEPARSLARGLAEARLTVYRVRSTVPDVAWPAPQTVASSMQAGWSAATSVTESSRSSSPRAQAQNR